MVLDQYETFIKGLLDKIKELGINVTDLDMDHIGYQSSSNEDYDRLRTEFDELGKRVSEEIVGGRRVGIYKLNKPLHYQRYTIMAIELVAPKEGQKCPSTLEHAEFVIDTDFDTFVKKYPNLDWNTSKVNQPTFPMITLKLSDTTQVKFHYKPVLDIVGSK